MTSRTQGWSCRADDSAVDDRDRDLQCRDEVLRTPTVLTTLHQIYVHYMERTLVATPQQECKNCSSAGSLVSADSSLSAWNGSDATDQAFGWFARR
jgi:hypothetical protein